MKKRGSLLVLALVIGFFIGLVASPHLTEKQADTVMDHKEHKQGHGDHAMFMVPENEQAPRVNIRLHEDPKSGWNLELETEHFTFAPESVGKEHVMGEGHAHVYINGEKITRLYAHWFYIEKLEPGNNEILVTLSTNDHKEYAIGHAHIQDSLLMFVE